MGETQGRKTGSAYAGKSGEVEKKKGTRVLERRTLA